MSQRVSRLPHLQRIEAEHNRGVRMAFEESFDRVKRFGVVHQDGVRFRALSFSTLERERLQLPPG